MGKGGGRERWPVRAPTPLPEPSCCTTLPAPRNPSRGPTKSACSSAATNTRSCSGWCLPGLRYAHQIPSEWGRLTPPSSLLLPPLASPCLLILRKFCFPCFESVPSISHGPRSPASLASLLPSLSAQSLLTITLVAFLKPWAHQGVDVLIQKAQNAFLKRVSVGSQFMFAEMSWVALLNHWLWSQRQQGWQ